MDREREPLTDDDILTVPGADTGPVAQTDTDEDDTDVDTDDSDADADLDDPS